MQEQPDERIEAAIAASNPETDEKINRTSAWGKKYPILNQYQKQVDVAHYGVELRKLLETLEAEYQLKPLDAMLVLKDILYHVWKGDV